MPRSADKLTKDELVKMYDELVDAFHALEERYRVAAAQHNDKVDKLIELEQDLEVLEADNNELVVIVAAAVRDGANFKPVRMQKLAHECVTRAAKIIQDKKNGTAAQRKADLENAKATRASTNAIIKELNESAEAGTPQLPN
ncbi:hypothetical protein [Phyllobacterium chamaecytisi]|uniref:hypothetical protein n=1 Tax=Phyllobacterium chamaecytisi TaxID=2876082 RepID=UPI001CCBBC2E|nr:hypothetical protein [Phyllobacterium sp. KW56]MBZ9602611.1 hypothetical protein [Phyllobacterium sp. KW56]